MSTDQTQPVYLIANTLSGQGQAQQLISQAQQRCEQLHRPLHVYQLDDPDTIDKHIDQACQDAADNHGLVIAAGGDGTLRAVAQRLFKSTTPMAAVASGTFNYFARNYGIPEQPDQALEIALTGIPTSVPLGTVNDQVFIINASLGLYSKLIREREEHSKVFGRHRLVAIISTLFTLCKGYRPLALQLMHEQRKQTILTPMVFMGINALQLRDVALPEAEAVEHGKMAVVMMKPVATWDLLRLCLRGLMRRLHNDSSLRQFAVDSLTIDGKKRQIDVVLDGERMKMATPLDFAIHAEALTLMTPATDNGVE